MGKYLVPAIAGLILSLLVTALFLIRKAPPGSPAKTKPAPAATSKPAPPAAVTPASAPSPAPPACASRQYTVTKEDSREGLWGISKKFFDGVPTYNYRIAQANIPTYRSLGPNPDLLKAGWVLTIPCLNDLPALDTNLVAVRRQPSETVSKARGYAKGPTLAAVCPPCPCSSVSSSPTGVALRSGADRQKTATSVPSTASPPAQKPPLTRK